MNAYKGWPGVAFEVDATGIRGYIHFACRHHVTVIYRGTFRALTDYAVLPSSATPASRGNRYSKICDEYGEKIWTRGLWGKPPSGCAAGEIQVTRSAPPAVATRLPGVSRQHIQQALEKSWEEHKAHSYAEFFRADGYSNLHLGLLRTPPSSRSPIDARGEIAHRPYLRLVVDNTKDVS